MIRRANHASNESPAISDPALVIARLGGAQEGTVRRAQLLAAGVSRHAIDHRAGNGHLHRVHHGVYLVGHTALARDAREYAALLACGDGAVLSHWSAAHSWGLIKEPPDDVHVTIINRRRRAKQGVRLHTVSRLPAADLRGRRRIPLTSPARTLIDLAPDAGYERLEAMVAEARVLKLLRTGELQQALERAGRRRGVGVMKAFLRHEGEPALTRSAAERLMRRLTTSAGLPQPVVNTRVAGWEVDFCWPEQRVIVEVDGYQFHGHRRAFERDRRKGLALAAAGHVLIRISTTQLVHQTLLVAAQLATAIANAS